MSLSDRIRSSIALAFDVTSAASGAGAVGLTAVLQSLLFLGVVMFLHEAVTVELWGEFLYYDWEYLLYWGPVTAYVGIAGLTVLHALLILAVGRRLHSNPPPLTTSLRAFPAIITYVLVAPLALVLKGLDYHPAGRRVTNRLFNDAAHSALAFAVPAAFFDRSVTSFTDAQVASGSAMRSAYGAPATVTLGLRKSAALVTAGLTAVMLLFAGISTVMGYQMHHTLGFIGHFLYFFEFLVEYSPLYGLAFVFFLYTLFSVPTTLARTAVYLSATGRLQDASLIPQLRENESVRRFPSAAFDFSPARTTGKRRGAPSSLSKSPLEGATIPSVNLVDRFVSEETRTRFFNGLRVIGTPIARLIFGLDAVLTRIARPLRKHLDSRSARIAGVAGLSVTAIVALCFVWLMLSVGPLSAALSVSVVGADVRDAQQGKSTVQPSYSLGTLLMEQEGFITEIENQREEKYGGSSPVSTLTTDMQLNKVAADHTVQMAAMGDATTVSPDGVSVTERMANAGLTCQKRFSTDDPMWDNRDENRSGETFTNSTPTAIVGSYHYGLDKQYTTSNEWTPLYGSSAMPDEQYDAPVEMYEPAKLFYLEGLNPLNTYETTEYGGFYGEDKQVQNDLPMYDSGADIGGLAPWHPDLVKFIHYTSEDVLADQDARAKLLNSSYTHYGFAYRVAEDRTVYYTIVLC